MSEKKSFFKKLASAVMPDQAEVSIDLEETPEKNWLQNNDGDGQLTVDVYETPTHIIVKTIVAGVKKEDMDISLSRDMITIKGSRHTESNVDEENYFHKELYWGSFSRTILLPEEVDIEKAEATENQGLLTVKLPKVDKERQARLRVKSL